jgi:hypothetical protein
MHMFPPLWSRCVYLEASLVAGEPPQRSFVSARLDYRFHFTDTSAPKGMTKSGKSGSGVTNSAASHKTTHYGGCLLESAFGGVFFDQARWGPKLLTLNPKP